MPKYFDFEISLLDIQPSIWRRIQLVAVSNFETLHDAIQDAFGWQRQHLYEFRHIDESGSVRTKSSQPVHRIARRKQAEILDDVVVPFADDLPLVSFFAEKKDCCLYLYDFGDNWQHSVELKELVLRRPFDNQRVAQDTLTVLLDSPLPTRTLDRQVTLGAGED